jgi:hypothetical protein
MMPTCLSTYIGHGDGSTEFAQEVLPGLHKGSRL